MVEERYDVAVVGAGMLGAAAAYRLACAGRRVLLIEAHEPASGTTGNSFAWVNAVSKEPESYHRLNAAGATEYAALVEELGEDSGYRGDGSLGWADAADEQVAIRDRVTRLAARGYAAEWITPDAARRLEPGLAIGPEVEGVAFYPGDGWVDAPRLVRALVNHALAEGADLWRNTAVASVRRNGDRITGLVTARGTVTADEVLFCVGIWTAEVLAHAGVSLPVGRSPGLLAVTSVPTAPLGRVVHAPGIHLRPDVSGGLLLGADDTDALTTEQTPPGEPPAYALPLMERAARVFPAAADARIVSVRIGIRPMPADRLTIAGRVPGVANAWVLATHSGITMGPLLGRLLAAEIVGAPADPLLRDFRPDRFRRLSGAEK